MSTAEDIGAAVCQALAIDPMVNARDIEVAVRQNGVLLNGTVPSQEQSAEATRAAGRVQGVGTIYNLLAVALPNQDYGDDAALAATTNQALRVNADVPHGVMATARLGSITLTGTVATTAQRRTAEDTVAGVGGVMSISNQIAVVAAERLQGG
jgi:osmotically-inducible protein OsmY